MFGAYPPTGSSSPNYYTTVRLEFLFSQYTTTTAPTDYYFSQLSFDPGTSYTMNGSELHIGGLSGKDDPVPGIVQNSNLTQTINNKIETTTVQTWTLAGGGGLNFTNGVDRIPST